MNQKAKKPLVILCTSAVMVALATVLSLIKVYQLPLGGSITLLSMLPIVMISVAFGPKWGLGSAFVYSAIQLYFGITIEGLLGWGLTSACLVGTIMLDYIIAFTLIGLSGVFRKKGYVGILIGTGTAIALRFVCHFLSGIIIFGIPADLLGNWHNVPFYSLCYNGSFMLPELIFTLIAAAVIFRIKPIQRLCGIA